MRPLLSIVSRLTWVSLLTILSPSAFAYSCTNFPSIASAPMFSVFRSCSGGTSVLSGSVSSVVISSLCTGAVVTSGCSVVVSGSSCVVSRCRIFSISKIPASFPPFTTTKTNAVSSRTARMPATITAAFVNLFFIGKLPSYTNLRLYCCSLNVVYPLPFAPSS